VVIGQLKASTPSPPGPPVMLPLPVIVIAPPLLKIGPEVGVAMIWGDGTQAAEATARRRSLTFTIWNRVESMPCAYSSTNRNSQAGVSLIGNSLRERA